MRAGTAGGAGIVHNTQLRVLIDVNTLQIELALNSSRLSVGTIRRRLGTGDGRVPASGAKGVDGGDSSRGTGRKFSLGFSQHVQVVRGATERDWIGRSTSCGQEGRLSS